MPTIKTKKEMNLPELIEWGFNNNVTGSYFAIDGVYAKRIRFESGVFVGMNGEFNKDDTFKLDIEEEITGDTIIPRILKIGVGSLSGYSAVEENVSVNRIINKKNKYIYIIDDDYAITPFYRDGKLVE